MEVAFPSVWQISCPQVVKMQMFSSEFVLLGRSTLISLPVVSSVRALVDSAWLTPVVMDAVLRIKLKRLSVFTESVVKL